MFLQICSALLGIAPVSYTHLDVYKRQGQNRGTSQDLKAVSEALSYLRQKGLSTVEEMCIRDRSSDEMKEAQIQAQEQEHIAWENAIPLGGKSSDVYCFDMALSVGDISDNGIGEQRKNVLKKMLSVWFVEDLEMCIRDRINTLRSNPA